MTTSDPTPPIGPDTLRSGMIAVKLLTAFGTLPGEASRAVRDARPGAIETREQEDCVLHGPPC